MKVSNCRFEWTDEGYKRVWKVEIEDSQELRIDIPDTDASIIIRAHHDGRFVIESPQDGWVRRMFIEPGSQDFFVLGFQVPSDD